jgi:hypothetical protein
MLNQMEYEKLTDPFDEFGIAEADMLVVVWAEVTFFISIEGFNK